MKYLKSNELHNQRVMCEFCTNPIPEYELFNDGHSLVFCKKNICMKCAGRSDLMKQLTERRNSNE